VCELILSVCVKLILSVCEMILSVCVSLF
jgi:hypothetical protein